jgi:nitrite reductase/ring-hydroxylating ferredoxin subunit
MCLTGLSWFVIHTLNCYKHHQKYHIKTGKIKANLNIKKYSFTQRVVTTWDSLADCVVTLPTVETFKHRLDKHGEDQPLRFNHLEKNIR